MHRNQYVINEKEKKKKDYLVLFFLFTESRLDHLKGFFFI